MEAEKYQIVAAAPGRNPVSVQQIAAGLKHAFQLDLSGVEGSWAEEGACVALATDLQEAKRIAALVLTQGADFSIVDAVGAVVDQGKAASDRDMGTVLGGFHAPPAVPPSPAKPPSGSPLVSRTDIELPPMDLRLPTGLVHDAVPAATEPAPSAGSTLGAGGAIDESSLVMLDGTEDAQAADISLSAFAPGGASAVSDSSFAPPDASDEPLELDETVSSVQPSPSPAGTAARPESFPSFGGQFPSLDAPSAHVSGPLPFDGAQSAAVGAQSEAHRAKSGGPPTQNGGAATHTGAMQAGSAIAQVRTGATRRGRSARRAGAIMLLVDRLRTFPRVHVAVGFALALGLGAILPMWHASSVMSSQVEPLRAKLSRAKVHGHLLAHTTGYESPQQIEARIDRITLRHRVLGFLLWLAGGGALLFLWFRFT